MKAFAMTEENFPAKAMAENKYETSTEFQLPKSSVNKMPSVPNHRVHANSSTSATPHENETFRSEGQVHVLGCNCELYSDKGPLWQTLGSSQLASSARVSKFNSLSWHLVGNFKTFYFKASLRKRWGSLLLHFFILFLSAAQSRAFCPKGCMCDDNEKLAVQCLDGKMDVVPILLNPNILHLDLSHNRIKTILPGFAFYHELKVLNISYNELVSLGEGNFISQKKLEVLIIKNNKISNLEGKAFDGLSSLREIDASYNYIENIHSNTFRYITQLKKLDLSGNRIRNLDSKVFQNLSSLILLNLCKNLIPNVSKEVFERLHNLRRLFLCSNEISSLSDYSFGHVKSLTYLSLENNNISKISPDALIGLKTLQELNLRDNLLQKIPTSELERLDNLEDLNLSVNILTDIHPHAFGLLRNLKSLSISQCPNLSSVSLNAFTGLSSLTSLEFNFNPSLSNFQVEILYPLEGLKRLVVRGNGIQSIDQSLLSVGELQYIDLRDNQFHCTCSLKWLQEASMNKTLDLKIEDLVCYSPETLKGRSISSVTDYDLKCYGYLITAAICVAAILTVLFFLGIAFIIYYKNCRKMKTLVHDNWPDKIVTTWKESDYQKQVEDDEYTFHSLRGIHHIPVTMQRQESGNVQSQHFYSSKEPNGSATISPREENLSKSRLMKSLTMPDARETSTSITNHKPLKFNSQKESKASKLSPSDIEGPYASISITNGFHRNHYEAPQLLSSHLYNPSTLYSDRQVPRTLHTGGKTLNSANHKISKDSGYYSCEFLVDQSSHSSPQSDSKSANGGGVVGGRENSCSSSHYRDSDTSANSRNSFRNHLPASDSGVFTLSRSYSRPSRLAQTPVESIYDNIL